MNFRKILIAVDSAPIAARAADVGAALARALGAEVGLIHVIEFPLGYAEASGVPASELTARSKQVGHQLLADFRQRVSAQPGVLDFLEVGRPGVEIVKAAAEWPADVIVIGSHGRGGVGRTLLGSVAEHVMRRAPCPVLVVRANADARRNPE